MKKKKIAILLNIIIILLEIIGLFISIKNNKKLLIEYYTIDSNIIALISSIMFLLDSYKYKRKTTEITKLAKFTSCVSLTLTMIIVLFVLFPISRFNTDILISGSMPIFHIICPLLVLFSFTKYEKYRFDSNDKYQVLIFTTIYGICLVLLNFLGLVIGPYPFLLVKKNPAIISIISFIGIYIITFSISTFIQKIKQRH